MVSKRQGKPVGSKSTVGSLKFRNRWRHIMSIDEMIRNNEAPSCDRLAVELKVCRRTVLRDIDFFRYELGAPIKYDASRRGYVYSEPNWAMPNVRMTEGELFAMLVAEKAMEAYAGTPWIERLKSVYERMIASLPDRIRVSPGDLLPRVCFGMNAQAKILPGVMETVGQAVAENRILKMSYKKLGADRAEDYEVDPYMIYQVQGAWYMIGKDRRTKYVPMFNISRIKSAKFQGGTFDYAVADFDPGKYLANTFVAYQGEGVHHIVLEFTGLAAELVMERQWHASQKVRELPGGKIRMEMSVSHLDDICPWIMSWGSGVRVIKPKSLADFVAAEARKVAKASC